MKRFIALLALIGLCLNASATELVVNGTFSDNAGVKTYSQTGWTVDSDAYYFKDNVYKEGSVWSTGVLSQTITGATGTLTLSFDYASPGGGYEYVRWNGDTLAFYLGAKSEQTYTFSVVATGNDTLSFSGRNLFSYNRVSDVSLVSAVPEPATYGMLLAGVGLMGAIARRRSGKAS